MPQTEFRKIWHRVHYVEDAIPPHSNLNAPRLLEWWKLKRGTEVHIRPVNPRQELVTELRNYGCDCDSFFEVQTNHLPEWASNPTVCRRLLDMD